MPNTKKGAEWLPLENKLNPPLPPTLFKLLVQVRGVVIMPFAELPRPELSLADQPIIL